MSKKFVLSHSKHEVGEQALGGGSVTLYFMADLPPLCNSYLPAATAYHAELSAEIEAALGADTEAKRELARRQSELQAAEGRVGQLAARLQAAPVGRDRAIECGDLATADRVAAELASLPMMLKNAEQRVRLLKENQPIGEAENAVRDEQQRIERDIRDRRAAELQPQIEKAKRAISDAVHRLYPALAEAQELEYIARTGRAPYKALYLRPESEIIAEEQRRADAEDAARQANLKRLQAESQAIEDAKYPYYARRDAAEALRNQGWFPWWSRK